MIDLSSLAGAIYYVTISRWWILLFIMTMEGPVITYVAAFAANLGMLNIWYVLFLSILGNVIGDIGLYLMGRFGRTSRIEAYLKKKRMEKGFIHKVEKNLLTRTGWTMALVKITPPHPAHGLVMAGLVRVPFPKFIYYSIITSIPFSIAFCILGYYTGNSYQIFLNYFHKAEVAAFVLTGVLIVLFAVGYFIYKKMLRKKHVRKEK